jgi:protein O-mannosyl-transferase
MSWVKRNKFKLLFLALLVGVSYVNSLGNEFVSDDVFAIVNNDNLGDFREALVNKFYFLRPFEYWIVFSLFGKKALFFRLINFVFHILTVWGVYALGGLLISSYVGLVAASIFAVHPLGVESVAWISAGSYVQATAFSLWSLIFYWLVIRGKNGIFEKKYYFWSMFLLLLALSSMERSVVVVGLMGVLSWWKVGLKKTWKLLILPIIFGGVWVLMSFANVGVRQASLQNDFYNNGGGGVSFWLQLPVAVGEYVRLFVWPAGLTLYHSDLMFTGVGLFIRVLILVGLLAGMIYSFLKKNKEWFFILWFFVCLSPTLLPLGISWIVAERYVYMAMVGLCLWLAMGVWWLREKMGSDGASLLLVILVSLFMIRTVMRNRDWKTADELWLSAERYSTLSPQNHNNLGDVYGKRGMFERSRDHLLRAIELNPSYADAMHNLGNTYLQMGEIEKAKESYLRALEVNPNLWQSEGQLERIEEYLRLDR